MRLEHFMTTDIEAIEGTSTVQQAAQQMRSLNIGFLPLHLEGALVGVVTDRDITTRATADGLDSQHATVAEIMTIDLVTCFEDQPVESALEVMNMHQVRRLIVIDQNQHVVGVVSLADLAARALTDAQTGAALEAISFPSPQLQKEFA